MVRVVKILLFLLMFQSSVVNGEEHHDRVSEVKKAITSIADIEIGEAEKISEAIVEYSSFYFGDIDMRIPVCLFYAESGFVSQYGDGGLALGIGQIHLASAKEVCKKFNIDCSNLKERLMSDNVFNVRISLGYLAILLMMLDYDIERALVAYNSGILVAKSGVSTKYLLRIKKCIRRLKWNID